MSEITHGTQTAAIRQARRWLWIRRVRPGPLMQWLRRMLRLPRIEFPLADGRKYLIDPLSHMGAEILQTGIYEAALTRTFAALLRPGDHMIDCGANEGYFSVLAARCVGAQGAVIAVEPVTALTELIDRNLSLNGLHCRIAHLALCDHDRGVELWSPVDHGASSMLRKLGTRMLVASQTMDQLLDSADLAGPIRLVKLDCEGAEGAIVRGATQTIAEARVDVWSIDYHPQIAALDDIMALDRALRSGGYRLVETSEGPWLYVADRCYAEVGARMEFVREVQADLR